jgi:hypothetical protein
MKIEKVHAIGDNYAVVNVMATDMSAIRAVPGRSPTPGAWSAVHDELMQLNALLVARAKPVVVEWVWVPRRWNVNADEICSATMQGRPPVFRHDLPPPPAKFSEPSADEMNAILRRVLDTPPDSIRTIPRFLKPLWLQTLAHISTWTCAPVALVAAPRVLLVRRAGDLRERLAHLAQKPDAVEQAFYRFAYGADELDKEEQQRDAAKSRTSTEPGSVNWEMVEKVAAQAPAKAIKMIYNRALNAPEGLGLEQLDAKRGAPGALPLPPPEGVAKPPWLSASAALVLAGGALARLTSPANDGWTRELFLSSVSSATAAMFEVLLNSLVRGEPLSASDVDPTMSARVVVWRKSVDSDKLRIIGMTSTLAKIAWRYVLSLRTPAIDRQALFVRGGTHVASRWAMSQRTVFMADVVDAYWRVDRDTTLAYLIKHGHPAAWLFWRQYRDAPPLLYGGKCLPLFRGVLPGCGGAAFAFAVDMAVAVPPTDSRWLYADDGACNSEASFREFITLCRAAGKDLSKARCVTTDPTMLSHSPLHIDGLAVEVVPAARYLGAYIGDSCAAVPLFAAHAATKTHQLVKLREFPLSLQAKWQIFRSVERSIVWDCTATPPAVVHACAPEIDARINDVIVSTFLPREAQLSQRSMALISIPIAHGGLGCLSVAGDCDALFNLASARLNVPDDDDAKRVGRFHTVRVRKECDNRKLQLAAQADIKLGRRADDSVAWFDIQPTTTRTTLTDDSFKLGLANHIDAAVGYPTCSDVEPTAAYDHSQCCPVCAGPYRYARHQRIQQEFLQTATAFGVIATPSLFSLGVKPTGQRPDVAIFRGLTKQIPLLVDFSVAHHREGHVYDASGKTDAVKIKKYASLLRRADGEASVEIAPFVVSTRGAIHYRTLKRIEEMQKLATRRGFAYELIRRVKIAVIEYEVFRKSALHMRKANGTLVWRDTAADSTADDEACDEEASAVT